MAKEPDYRRASIDEFEPASSETHDTPRRRFLVGGGLVAGAMLTAGANAQTIATDTAPRELAGKPVPEPPPEKSAGPVKPGRGSTLTGKVAVVTGAARGIGRAIAVEFAANGADVVAIDIAGPVSPASNAVPATPAELAETVSQIQSYGRKVESIRLDIRDIGVLRAAAEKIESEFGKIDIVVANAAIQRWKPLLEMEDSDWRDVIDNNLNGTANTLRAFAPTMVRQGRGRIIVLSSMQGLHGTKHAASYSASKWGILGLMKSAAMEFGEHNITVNAILPGLVDTPLTRYETRLRESMAETGQKPPEDPTPQQAWDVRAPTLPMKVGWLQPDDISPTAVFLASDAAAMVTGAEFQVTGGDSAKSV
jgi:NAD(P)-dependent dehydrogenase (short-subunit alcohol dehydrogenase family)